MAEYVEPVINNFNIDAQSLVDWIAQGERKSIIETLLNNGVFRTKDGQSFEALVYENWESRDEEGHTPAISSINITYNQSQPEVPEVQEEN